MPHDIQFATYLRPIPFGMTNQPEDAPVLATMVSGAQEYRSANDDIGDGGMAAYVAEGGEIAPYTPAPPTGPDVNAERARRIAAGTDIELSDGTTVALQGRPQDMTNLLGLYTTAAAREAAGDATPLTFRGRTNAVYNLTPAQVIELHFAGQAWVERVYEASWALKDGEAIPTDFADDARWP